MTAILQTFPLGFPWQTLDPFLFCVHHDDNYPAGNDKAGPKASLAGRDLGMDFEIKDGFRMYHGREVPGFPPHPHRGFETVTIARRGLIDHSDSLGAAARFGRGDVQWLTAGKGIVHAEMFPLLDTQANNRVELFQIWLNLPRAEKFAEPHFSMQWADEIPRVTSRDAEGRATEVTVIAGALGNIKPLAPPPHSWASRPESDVAIWTVRMEPGATWQIPAAKPGTNRVVYLFAGNARLDGKPVAGPIGVRVQPDVPFAIAAESIEAGNQAVEILVLQGRPIGEPVVQHGPFVMTTRQEIQQTFLDYQRTQFGGWPWPSDEPVHPREEGRFARYPDGRVERPVDRTRAA